MTNDINKLGNTSENTALESVKSDVLGVDKFLKVGSFLTLGLAALSTVVPAHGLSTLALSVASVGMVAASFAGIAGTHVSMFANEDQGTKKLEIGSDAYAGMKKKITKTCFLALGSVVAVNVLANQGLIQDGFVGALQLSTAFMAYNSLIQFGNLKSNFEPAKEDLITATKVEKQSFMSKIGNLRNNFFSSEKESTLKLGG